jgi:hypothetical protein
MNRQVICSKCGAWFTPDEREMTHPLDILGAIFLSRMTDGETAALCPACREQAGLLSMSGFGS